MLALNIKIVGVLVLLFVLILSFPVFANPDPVISILSPANSSYNYSSLWVNFSVSGNIDWCAYSLNSGSNVTDIFGKKEQFNDSLTERNVTFAQPGNGVTYARLNKNSTVVYAKMNVSGVGYDGWKLADSNTSNNIWGVEFLNSTFGFAVGQLGTILKWDGQGWSSMSSPVSSTLNDVSIYNSTMAFAVMANGSGGYVLKWNGSQWALDWSVGTALYSVDIADWNLAFAGDQNGNLYKWNGSWYNVTSPLSGVNNYVRGISMINETFGFAVAMSDIAKWNGTTWAYFDSISGANFKKVKLYNSTYGFAANSEPSQNRELVKWDGNDWSEIATTGTDGLWGVGVYDGQAFAVGENGRIVRCDGFDCSEAYSPTSSDLYCSDILSDFGYSGGIGGVFIKMPGYPGNVTMDIAASGGANEWNYTGELNSSMPEQEINFNVSLINQFLSGCSPSGGYCDLLLNFSSVSIGNLGLSNLTVSYVNNNTFNGTEGYNSLVIYANDTSGIMNSTSVYFTVDLTDPVLLYGGFNPSIVINGSNISVQVNSTDNISGVDSVWANITLPNTSFVFVPLSNNNTVNFTTSVTGRYNVTFFANDSSGNVANSSVYYFLTKPSYDLNITINDFNSSGVNGSVTIYYPNSSEIISSFNFTGSMNQSIPEYVYDILFSSFNDTLKIKFFGFNVSNFSGSSFLLDELSTPATGYLSTYGINTTFGTVNASVIIGYNGSVFTNESYLGLYKCDQWNFTGRNCTGNWTNITNSSTRDNVTRTFSVYVTNFSGFSVKQESYCGDGTKDTNETCDGSDFGGLTCVSYSFVTGSLACNVACSAISTAGCSSGSPGGSPGSAAPSGVPGAIAPSDDDDEETETCVDGWDCEDWSMCMSDGIQMRTCTYDGNCSGKINRTEIRNCTFVPENVTIECGDGVCEAGENCTLCEKDCGLCKTDDPGLLGFWWVLPVVAAVAFGGLFSRKYLSRGGKKTGKKISIEDEREHITNMMKLAQTNYYQKKIISKTTYEAMIDQYRQRMEEITREKDAEEEVDVINKTKKEAISDESGKIKKEKEEIASEERELEKKKLQLMRESREIKDQVKKEEDLEMAKALEKKKEMEAEAKTPHDSLIREKEVMLNLVKTAQTQYFEQGKISKELYDMRVKAARNRIAQIEEELSR